MKEEFVSLHNLGAGAAMEKFDRELSRVLENIVDPNTRPKKPRKVTLELQLTPNEDRTAANVRIEVRSSLAPPRGVDTRFFLGLSGERVVAVESNPKQMDFSDLEPKAAPTLVKFEGGSK